MLEKAEKIESKVKSQGIVSLWDCGNLEHVCPKNAVEFYVFELVWKYMEPIFRYFTNRKIQNQSNYFLHSVLKYTTGHSYFINVFHGI